MSSSQTQCNIARTQLIHPTCDRERHSRKTYWVTTSLAAAGMDKQMQTYSIKTHTMLQYPPSNRWRRQAHKKHNMHTIAHIGINTIYECSAKHWTVMRRASAAGRRSASNLTRTDGTIGGADMRFDGEIRWNCSRDTRNWSQHDRKLYGTRKIYTWNCNIIHIFFYKKLATRGIIEPTNKNHNKHNTNIT